MDINNYETKIKILKSFLASYQKRHLYKDGTPMTNTFLITNRCNLKCAHCFNHLSSNNMKELTIDEYEKISQSMSFFASAFFCGGETFIREDLAKIVEIFRKNNNIQWASATTNGTLPENIIPQLIEICLQDKNKRFTINFSLDGFKEQHDIIRGKGVYDKCISTILEVKKIREKYKNLDIGVVTAMSTINEYYLSDFFEYVAETLSPQVINLLLVRQSPRAGVELKNIDIKNYKKATNKLLVLHKQGKNGNLENPLSEIPFAFYRYIEKTINLGKRTFQCYAGRHGMVMRADGEVNVCEVLNDKGCTSNPMTIGNIRDYNYNFMDLWNSEEALEVKKWVNRADCCEKCTHETEGLLPSIYFEPNFF